MRQTKLFFENLDIIGGGGGRVIWKKHFKLIPNSFQVVFCGPSDSGKNNFLLSLLISEDELKLKIYSKLLCQPKYQLQTVLKKLAM